MSKKIVVLISGLIAVAAGAYVAGTSALERRLGSAVREAGVSVQDVSVRPAWGSLLRGRFGAELVLNAPELTLRWSKENGISGLSAKSLAAVRGGKIPVVQIRVREGKASLLDQTVSPEVPWDFNRLAFTAQIDWPARRCAFKGNGALAGPGGSEKGRLQAEGSAVLPGGPVDATLHLAHGEAGDLAPYIRQVLGVAPSRGKAEVTSRVTLHQGVLMTHNEVTAMGVVFPPNETTVLGPDGNQLVQLLQDGEGKMRLSFLVTGEIGKGLDWSDLAAGAMRESVQQAMARGIQRVLTDTEQQPVEDAVRHELDSR